MEHSQQNQTLTTAASQLSTPSTVVLPQEKQPKSNLRRQLDDLLYGSVSIFYEIYYKKEWINDDYDKDYDSVRVCCNFPFFFGRKTGRGIPW